MPHIHGLRRLATVTVALLGVGALALAGATTAAAATVTYSGTISSADAEFAFPHPCQPNHTHDPTLYDAQPFAVSQDGLYELRRTTTAGSSDGVFLLYQDAFDPAAAESNCIAFNDDGDVSLDPGLDQVLEAGRQYVLVTTQLSPDEGRAAPIDYTITITGPGDITLGARPTLVVEQQAGQADPAPTLPVRYSATFSQAVTGFDAADVVVTGTAGGGGVVVTGSGADYVIEVGTATTAGTIVVSVPADAATSSQGLGSTASTSSDAEVAFAPPAPSVTVEQAAGQADPAAVDGFAFDVTFSEPVEGLEPSDVVVAGGTGASTVTIAGSGSTYVVTISGATQAGDVTASLSAAAAVGAYGVPSEASTSTDGTVTYAPVAPSPSPSAPAPSAPAPSAPAPSAPAAPSASLPETGAEPAWLLALAAALLIGVGSLAARRRTR